MPDLSLSVAPVGRSLSAQTDPSMTRRRDAAATRSARNGEASTPLRVALAPAYRDPLAVLVTASGEIDIATAHLLDAALGEAAERATTAAHVDLSDVSFCDCAGISTLLAARHRHPPAVVVAASPFVRRLFDLAGATHLWRHATRPHAPLVHTRTDRYDDRDKVDSGHRGGGMSEPATAVM